MAISMHSASVPIFVRMLGNMLSWLDKAEAHAKAKNFDPGEPERLTLRTPDGRRFELVSSPMATCHDAFHRQYELVVATSLSHLTNDQLEAAKQHHARGYELHCAEYPTQPAVTLCMVSSETAKEWNACHSLHDPYLDAAVAKAKRREAFGHALELAEDEQAALEAERRTLDEQLQRVSGEDARRAVMLRKIDLELRMDANQKRQSELKSRRANSR